MIQRSSRSKMGRAFVPIIILSVGFMRRMSFVLMFVDNGLTSARWPLGDARLSCRRCPFGTSLRSSKVAPLHVCSPSDSSSAQGVSAVYFHGITMLMRRTRDRLVAPDQVPCQDLFDEIPGPPRRFPIHRIPTPYKAATDTCPSTPHRRPCTLSGPVAMWSGYRHFDSSRVGRPKSLTLEIGREARRPAQRGRESLVKRRTL